MALRDLSGKADPIRRVYIPKPGKQEQRSLGIPMACAYCISSPSGLGNILAETVGVRQIAPAQRPYTALLASK
jgi:hypothetical protein